MFGIAFHIDTMCILLLLMPRLLLGLAMWADFTTSALYSTTNAGVDTTTADTDGDRFA